MSTETVDRTSKREWPESIEDIEGHYYRRCGELNVAAGKAHDAPAGGAISYQAQQDNVALYAEAKRRWKLAPAADRMYRAVVTQLTAEHNGKPTGTELRDAVNAYEKAQA
jgi:hypothetical protein